MLSACVRPLRESLHCRFLAHFCVVVSFLEQSLLTQANLGSHLMLPGASTRVENIVTCGFPFIFHTRSPAKELKKTILP